MSIVLPENTDSTEDTERYANSPPVCKCGGNLIYIQGLNMTVCDTCEYEETEAL
jgi:hypothetical protein